MSDIPDEEVPFLAGERPSPARQKTPLPRRSFSLVLLLRISGSITDHVLAPFLPQLIRDLGVTRGKDSRIGYYVGILHSLFYFTEACTAFYWSRLSDKIGRKPVLLFGLFGLMLSMWCIGFSKTFWLLVLSHCLHGALDGNIGVIKSVIIEITDSTNLAQAYSILPMTGAIGTTIGPLIGGSLSKPAERFPELFGNSRFLKEYPYFLPCSVAVAFTALTWLIAFIFFKETTKPRMSPKQYLLGGMSMNQTEPLVHAVSYDDEPFKQLPFRALFTRPVLIAVGSYSTLALIEIAFSAITPVFYAMPIDMGGLNLDPPAIGTIMAVFGIPGGIIQYIFFAPMHDWLGARRTFLTTVSLNIPAIALFPLINAVARGYGPSYFLWFLVGLQKLLLKFSNFAFEISLMFIGAASPNKASIGATNGLAQTTVALMRTVGPALVNSAFSLSIEKNIMGGYLAYLVMAAIVVLNLWVGRMLPKNMWNE